jgi:hypothetical protein
LFVSNRCGIWDVPELNCSCAIPEVSGDVLTSKTRVNAGTGVYAGTLGIYSMGLITSLVSVNAPFGNFATATNTGVMNATWMRDSVNSKVFNNHQHPVLSKDFGMTGTPTVPFI